MKKQIAKASPAPRRRAGFTLVEMLIVVAIIAILIAVAIPVYSSSLRKAEKAVAQSNVSTMMDLIEVNKLTLGLTSLDGYSSSVSKKKYDEFDKALFTAIDDPGKTKYNVYITGSGSNQVVWIDYYPNTKSETVLYNFCNGVFNYRYPE